MEILGFEKKVNFFLLFFFNLKVPKKRIGKVSGHNPQHGVVAVWKLKVDFFIYIFYLKVP